jgi:hypothetical protein
MNKGVVLHKRAEVIFNGIVASNSQETSWLAKPRIGAMNLSFTLALHPFCAEKSKFGHRLNAISIIFAYKQAKNHLAS